MNRVKTSGKAYAVNYERFRPVGFAKMSELSNPVSPPAEPGDYSENLTRIAVFFLNICFR
jgi:hypothetical protein